MALSCSIFFLICLKSAPAVSIWLYRQPTLKNQEKRSEVNMSKTYFFIRTLYLEFQWMENSISKANLAFPRKVSEKKKVNTENGFEDHRLQTMFKIR